ncbi:hypothetical protein A6A21_09805 [Phocoenobacter uteri]|nr:hypothetical protein [Phocoenobacter uteri]
MDNASRIPKACRKQGCKHITIILYCEQHKQRYQSGKTSTQRGYGAKWRRIRAIVLDRDKHLCQLCLKQGIYTSATTVDHIIPKAQMEQITYQLTKLCHKLNMGGGM